MTKVTVLVALLGVAALAACSKSPPPAEVVPPPPGASAAATADVPQPVAQKAERLKTLIADKAECQAFRTELDETGKSPTATGAQLNEIVARAGAAGCTQAPSAP